MSPEPRPEHKWLDRLHGEWTVTTEAVVSPGEPASTFSGTESVRSLDGLWAVCEGRGQADGVGTSIMSLGFDPTRGRFIGTFIGMGMTHLWLYDGHLDASGARLTLYTDGPSYLDADRMARYRDVIEAASDDERTTTSCYQDDAGAWVHFMTARYRRAG